MGKHYIKYRKAFCEPSNQRKRNLTFLLWLCFACFNFTPSGFALENTIDLQESITGTVTDEAGIPLPGVSISVKDTNRGTITNFDGEYSILASEDEILVVSFMGFQTQEIPVGEQTNIDIVLAEDMAALDEVVVVGYGTTRKVNLTGAVSTIDSEDIQGQNYPNLQTALQGKLPGLTITQPGGMPGNEDMTMSIRGVSTFSSNPPLIIVDGQPREDMSSLNPQDIESVTILKDAASGAIYGARASGGVILITTKDGVAGEMKFSYTGSYGAQDITTYPKQLNAYEHTLLYTEAERNDNPDRTVFTWTPEQIEKYRTGELPSIDKMDYLLKPASQTEHNISISGGNDQNTYYFNIGYLDQGSPIKGFGYKRLSLRLKDQFRIKDNLVLDINVGYVPGQISHPGLYRLPRSIPQTTFNLFLEAYRRDATQPLFTSDGNWATIGGWKNLIGIFSDDGGWGETNKSSTTGIATLKWNILKDLSIEGSYNGLIKSSRMTNYSNRMNFYDPNDESSIGYVLDENTYDIDNENGYHHQLQALMNYNKIFSTVHDFQLLLGASSEWARDNAESVGRSYFLTDDIYAINAGSGDRQNWRTSGMSSNWAISSLFSRLNYAYNNKYLFETNLRYDGSSRFASDVRWGLFPSASFGWRISEESFFREMQNYVHQLKIRASWGQVGNQSTSLYQHYPRLATSSYYFAGEPFQTVSYSNSINNELTWETKTTTNLGLDIRVKKINFSFDVFKDRTSDILMVPVVPSTYGLPAPVMNVGTVVNRGWEAMLEYRDAYKDFSWATNFQISDAKNEVIDMIGSPVIGGNMITEVGNEMNRWYGYRSEGIFETQAQVDAHAFQNIRTGIGDLIYADIDGNGEINANDRVDLGSSRPRFPFGIALDLRWKNLDFNAFLQGVAKQLTFISGPTAQPFYRDLGTALVPHKDRWHQDDTGNWIPGYYPKLRIGGVNINNFSSFWLQNSAYLRLKNIQLGYTLPDNLTEKLQMDTLRIYLNGQNLLTFSKMIDGVDPEAPSGIGEDPVGGGSYFPLYKSLSLNVNVTF